MTFRVLVTGGAGYIGRYVMAAAVEAGCLAFSFDVRDDGHYCDMLDRAVLRIAVEAANPHAIIHLAAHSSVAESVRAPGKYAENVQMCRNLAEAARGVPIVLASSAAVYGEGGRDAIPEWAPLAPVNPYGWSKLASEAALPNAMALRLFNVAGGEGDRGDHLIPQAVRSCAEGRCIRVNGDGQAVRDFVHVEDVAQAFVAAALAMSVGTRGCALNICTGLGTTVHDAANLVCAYARPGTRVEWAPDRAGDVRRLVGDNARARREIGWTPQKTFEDTVASAIGYDTALAAHRRRRPHDGSREQVAG